MNKLQHVLVTVALVSSACGAAAQTLKPGLWEITNKISSSSGEMGKAMAEAQKDLADMPADQRKMMQDMMAKQGGGMGATVVKMCITQEMAQRNEVATQQGDCKHTNSPRVGNSTKFSFVCAKPPSSGDGQVTFVSAEAYTMKMTLNTPTAGKPEKMNMDATGKFLSAECGKIKPIVIPKK